MEGTVTEKRNKDLLNAMGHKPFEEDLPDCPDCRTNENVQPAGGTYGAGIFNCTCGRPFRSPKHIKPLPPVAGEEIPQWILDLLEDDFPFIA